MFGQGKFSEIFGELPREILNDFNRHCKDKLYGKGQVILQEGTPTPVIHFLRSGHVKLYKTGVDGKQQIVGLAGPGDILGYRSLFDGGPHRVTVAALEPLRAATAEIGRVLSLLERHARFGMAFLEKLVRDLNAAEDLATSIAQRPVRERLAKFLLMLGDRFGKASKSGVLIRIPLSHEEIGEAIGVTRETATRLLSQFRRERMMAARNREIILLNPEKLRL